MRVDNAYGSMGVTVDLSPLSPLALSGLDGT